MSDLKKWFQDKVISSVIDLCSKESEIDLIGEMLLFSNFSDHLKSGTMDNYKLARHIYADPLKEISENKKESKNKDYFTMIN